MKVFQAKKLAKLIIPVCSTFQDDLNPPIKGHHPFFEYSMSSVYLKRTLTKKANITHISYFGLKLGVIKRALCFRFLFSALYCKVQKALPQVLTYSA